MCNKTNFVRFSMILELRHVWSLTIYVDKENNIPILPLPISLHDENIKTYDSY